MIRIAKCVYGSSDSGTSGHFYSTTEPFWLAWRYWSFKNTLSLLPPFIENPVSLSILLISSFYYCTVNRQKIMSNCRQVLFQSAAISASGSIQFLSLAFRLKNRRNFPLSTKVIILKKSYLRKRRYKKFCKAALAMSNLVQTRVPWC